MTCTIVGDSRSYENVIRRCRHRDTRRTHTTYTLVCRVTRVDSYEYNMYYNLQHASY